MLVRQSTTHKKWPQTLDLLLAVRVADLIELPVGGLTDLPVDGLIEFKVVAVTEWRAADLAKSILS